MTRSSSARFPFALLWGLGLCGVLSLVTWAGVRLSVDPTLAHVVFLGDSTVQNHRLPPGTRMEDRVPRALGPGWSGHNVAVTGARVADLFLQLHRAELLVGRVDLAVLGFAPAIFVQYEGQPRLSHNGAALRWLPLDRAGYEYYENLSETYQRIAVPQKLGLLFGFTDLVSELWDQQVTWRARRKKMAARSATERRAKLLSTAQREERQWRRLRVDSYESLAQRAEADDLARLARYLQARRIPTVVLLMPAAHPAIAREVFSPQTLAKEDRLRGHVKRLCTAHGLSVLDFGTPEELKSFPGADWEDIHHLKSPAAYQHMVSELGGWVHAHLNPAWHANASL